MPSKSAKQHKFMAAVANNPAFAKKAGVPQSVGKEFTKADKGKTFKKGGEMKKNCGPKGYADGGSVKKGGAISASGADMAGPQGKTLSQPVKKSVTGDTVGVRGVGAARARVARVY